MKNSKEYYFKDQSEFRKWLHNNHMQTEGIFLIFYKVEHEMESMRWEEAVRVALCYGWIDSTVKSLGNGKRRQYFCQRKAKSVWSKINKDHIKDLKAKKLMHKSGLNSIKLAKSNGSWNALDDVERGVIPLELQTAFDKNPLAYSNFKNFSRSQRKSYLYWLNQAKRDITKEKRISEIIKLCARNIKSRDSR
ncbi:hypothetical protein GH721_05510 [Kriegella sp. EG-1]|nr:hypothetical protein [Flavobacteriaceae bacterium EG-1]